MPKESVPQTPRKEKRFGWWTEGIRLCLPPELSRYMPRTDAGVKRTQRCRAARCDTLRLLGANPTCARRATSTALSPSGEKPRHPIAPLIKGSWRRRRLRGQPLKKRPGIRRIPGLHTYYLLLFTYYLPQCLHTSSPFSASSTIVLPAARSPLRISRAISVSALLWR